MPQSIPVANNVILAGNIVPGANWLNGTGNGKKRSFEYVYVKMNHISVLGPQETPETGN